MLDGAISLSVIALSLAYSLSLAALIHSFVTFTSDQDRVPSLLSQQIPAKHATLTL